VLRTLDKVEKEDAAVLIKELERAGMNGAEAANLHEIISTRRSTDETLRMLAGLAGRNQVFEQGLDELNSIVKAIGQFGVPESAFCVDLSVVRGLDYYTGTIYETTLLDHPELGSVCSGGRYDDLAGHFTDTKLPGVGISIGLTRLFSKLKEAGLAGPPPRSPSEALVTTMDHRYLDQYLEFGRLLRQSDINTEIYLEEAKLKKQLEYANKKGFRVAIIAGENEIGSGVVQVKNLVSQTSSDFALDQMVSGVKAALEKKGS
jgi:histidyl-tRNA synthetase